MKQYNTIFCVAGLAKCDGVSECEASKLYTLNVDGADVLSHPRSLEIQMERAWHNGTFLLP